MNVEIAGMQKSSQTINDNRQFVTFNIGREVFAVPMAPVEEIIRVPKMIHVPLAPTSLKGLSNLRGKVLPVVSLRHSFDFDEIEYDDATRVLVINHGTPVGFVVDRVTSVIAAEIEQLEDVEGINSTVDSAFLDGVIKGGQGQMTMILNFERLISSEFDAIAKQVAKKEQENLAQTTHLASSNDEVNDELQLVSFEVAGQEYAFPIEQVQEIVQIIDNISKIPKTEDHVVGVMTLRNRLLPLVSLRQMFALPSAPITEHNRVVVVTIDNNGAAFSVGIIMDTVKEVLRVNRTIVDDLPTFFSLNEENHEVECICRLDGGKRLVSVLSVEKMFGSQKLLDAVKTVYEGEEEVTVNERLNTKANREDDEEQFVIFRLSNEEYGVPIDSVQEIVRIPEELTHVPKAPSFVEGVINLRGSVLPVVDQCRRFGLPTPERNERQRIMVFLVNGVRTGFIVDSVSEVLKISKSVIEPSPNLSEEQARVIHRVANIEKQKRMIMLLDIDQTLDQKETKKLAKIT